jgi:hypothetical protein
VRVQAQALAASHARSPRQQRFFAAGERWLLLPKQIELRQHSLSLGRGHERDVAAGHGEVAEAKELARSALVGADI